MAHFCTASKLRIDLYFYRVVKKRRICDGDCMCPRKPKIFTVWIFTESLPIPALGDLIQFHGFYYLLYSNDIIPNLTYLPTSLLYSRPLYSIFYLTTPPECSLGISKRIQPRLKSTPTFPFFFYT